MHANNEFDRAELKHFLKPTLTHIHLRDDHVGFIERSVRTIKERFRSTCIKMTFRSIKMLMVRSLFEVITDVLNAFPSKNLITQTIITAITIKGKPKLGLHDSHRFWITCVSLNKD